MSDSSAILSCVNSSSGSHMWNRVSLTKVTARIRSALKCSWPAALVAAACGSIVTILLIDPALLSGVLFNDLAANWASAVGSICAVGVALHLAGSAKRDANEAARIRAEVALRLLWPDLRNYQAALKRLNRSTITTESWSKDINTVHVQRILGQLGSDSERVFSLSRDLQGPQLAAMSQAVAHIRHAERHATELLMHCSDNYVSVSSWQSKQQAARKSSSTAQQYLHQLIDEAKLLV
ncbi:hypothetical protein [Xanthomonas vasicola]|uniref:SLATT domain-containing protein n=1 Tax=Xanthomonas vasicola TaxID=56459 RepID=A0ABD7SE24_XANVA|nr:hypothetical protein [Xanthomonas vasicola]MDO6972923.1 hypothetical protein [Xanthomonas vasicola]MDO6986415.1 hypothetical protein [Xanthomonas vasicola]TWQ19116.1 hypothetical protein FQK00_20950 [Xanthomonas vasicola]TWQ29786.1 hypothetical protein FQJ97_21310 [Xanthomonas vasicola]TWQ36190.1 hypothetical protein FQJ99_10100 [Xanthomonas vasicola]